MRPWLRRKRKSRHLRPLWRDPLQALAVGQLVDQEGIQEFIEVLGESGAAGMGLQVQQTLAPKGGQVTPEH